MSRLIATWLLALWAPLSLAGALPAVALYYGAKPPLDALKAFDVVVVEPDQPGTDPAQYHHDNSALFAYVSVGEVREERAYFSQIPNGWLRGSNPAWGSRLIDQSAAGWPAFFADKVIAPLWARGYRGFFLDTLDAYQLFAKTPEARAQQEAGLKAVVREVKRRWPDAKLVFNRGFEILPDVHNQVYMVAAESLFQGWNAERGEYVAVSAQDRDWLLGQLNTVKKQYGLPVLVIDYVPPAERDLARRTARKIHELGFIPWVSTPSLDMLGVGAVEVIPREVLVIYDPHDWDDTQTSAPQRFLSMPLTYLGLVVRFQSVSDPLPREELRGRYAGIVSWLNSVTIAEHSGYTDWLLRQVQSGVPVAVFSEFGFGPDAAAFQKLGLNYHEEPGLQGMRIEQQNPNMGFELPLRPRMEDIYPLTIMDKGEPWLTLGNGHVHFHTTAIMPWGGYALTPYTVETLPGKDLGERWYINPLEFLKAALRIDTSEPVPDITTEMGRRMLMVHIDGDAFMNKAERPGTPFAGQVLLDDVLKRYTLPTTVSVIEGELSTDGLYPKLSAQLEPIARKIFALPHVEIASHTYSHPFNWFVPHLAAGNEGGYHLPIPGYHFNLHREIDGSVDYINEHLAPPGKRVKILLWSGNCVATPEALAETVKVGVLNMNGGDTIITRHQDSWTRIAGPGLYKGEYYQVFAPDENENVYTNLWTGPFYGYEKVIETFEMTERPYRFKPVDVYYHLYAVTKTASLSALNKVYQWAQSQPLYPVYASDYILKVLDFNHFAVARTLDGDYRLRGDGYLHTVRLPEAGAEVNLAASHNVAGVAPGPKARYVQLSRPEAVLVLHGHGRVASIAGSNAALTRFERDEQGLRFGLAGYVPVQLELADAAGCQLFNAGKPVAPQDQRDALQVYQFAAGTLPDLRLDCPALMTAR